MAGVLGAARALPAQKLEAPFLSESRWLPLLNGADLSGWRVDGPTRSALEIPEASENPLMLQGDHGPVAYRNIYFRTLT